MSEIPNSPAILNVPICLLFFQGFLKYLPIFIKYFYENDITKYSKEKTAGTEDKLENGTFDFIIVGAGSAGSLLAYRLSEKFSVLLIEAGGEANPYMDIPITLTSIQHFDEYDWMFESEPLRNCALALNGHKFRYQQGKVLGGTSCLNGVFYMRGDANIYDTWAQITNSSQWEFKNVLPIFKRFENFEDFDDDIHGKGGEINVQKASWGPLRQRFVDGAKELGHRAGDLNGGSNAGVSFAPLNILNGERRYGYNCFIKPARKRMTIFKYSTAKKIMIDEDKRAWGVEYKRLNKTYIVKARNEIIISAGNFNTPRLLTLSGIGNKELLNKLEIPQILNVRGSFELQDHYGTILGPFTMNRSDLSFQGNRDFNRETIEEYFENKTGPLSVPGGTAIFQFISETGKRLGRKIPDIQINMLERGIFKGFEEELSHFLNFDVKMFEKYFKPAVDKPSFITLVFIQKSSSKGNLTFEKTAEDSAKPIINLGYFDHPDDVSTLIDGIEMAVKLFEETKPFKEIQTKFAENKFPGCEEFEFRTRNYWDCYVRHVTISIFHTSGSVKMGPKNSPETILDPDLKVKGIDNLRVADASAFPLIPNSNINAACYLVGEKAADLITKEWSKQ